MSARYGEAAKAHRAAVERITSSSVVVVRRDEHEAQQARIEAMQRALGETLAQVLRVEQSARAMDRVAAQHARQRDEAMAQRDVAITAASDALAQVAALRTALARISLTEQHRGSPAHVALREAGATARAALRGQS